MSLILDALKLAFDWLKNNSLAIGVWLYERLLGIIRREKMNVKVAELKVKQMENQDAIDAKYSGKSDLDIVRDAISEGSKPKDS